MVISAMFPSENKTVAETNQQQENKIVEQEDTLPSLQERKQLWQALEQKQKQQQQQQQQQQQEQGEKIKFANNHNKILIGNKKQQQISTSTTINQTGVSGGEYYVAVGKLPKSPSFHSGLDLLADDKCDEQTSNGGHDYANCTDNSRHFVFNSKTTTTTTTNGRENISHENLIKMQKTLQQQQQQQQVKQINSTMTTPLITTTTTAATTSTTNVNNSTPTMISTAVPSTVATITISSTLVSTLAQQFSTNIKTTPNNLAVGTTQAPTTTTTATAPAAVATTTTNGESSTATTSLFTASYKSPVSAATAIKNILNSTKGVGNAVANNASNILGFNGTNNNNISTNLKHESNNKQKLSATASMLINETVQQLTKNSTLESQKARFDENSSNGNGSASGSSSSSSGSTNITNTHSNTMPSIKNGPNSLTSTLPHTLQQLSGSPGRARDRNVFHAPTTPTNVAALPLLRGLSHLLLYQYNDHFYLYFNVYKNTTSLHVYYYYCVLKFLSFFYSIFFFFFAFQIYLHNFICSS